MKTRLILKSAYRIYPFIFAAAFLLFLFNPAGSTNEALASDQGKKVLKAVGTDGFDTLEPGSAYTQVAWNMFRGLHRTLFTYRASLDPSFPPTLVPDLAKDMGTHNKALTEWTFRIKTGVKFGLAVGGKNIPGVTGAEVTASDIKYAIERMFLPAVQNIAGGYSVYYEDISGVSEFRSGQANHIRGIMTYPNDSKKITFKLNKPVGHLPHLLAMPATAPVPKRYAAPFDAEELSTYELNFVTTGPYYLQNAAETGRFFNLNFRRNAYWNAATDGTRKAFANSFEMTFGYPSDNVAIEKVLSGDFNLALQGKPSPSQLERAENRNLVFNVRGGATTYIYFNLDTPPLDNELIRKAINFAIDRHELVEIRGGGDFADIATSILPPGLGGHIPSNVFNPFFSNDPGAGFMSGDMIKARNLFLQVFPSGSTDIPLLVLTRKSEDGNPDNPNSVLARLQDIGFTNVRIETAGGEFYGYVFDDAFAIETFGMPVSIGIGTSWAADFRDAVSFFLPLFDPESPSNYGGVNDADLNRLMSDLSKTDNPTQRANLWANANRIATEKAYLVPFSWNIAPLIYSSSVKNVTIDPLSGLIDWTNADLKE